MLRGDAHYLIAIAQNDDAKEPEAKTALREAADAAGAAAEIEVYPADHGWCVPDSPAYDQPAAERARGRLLATYAERCNTLSLAATPAGYHALQLRRLYMLAVRSS